MARWLQKLARKFNGKSKTGKTAEQQRQAMRLSKWLKETETRLSSDLLDKYQTLSQGFDARSVVQMAERTTRDENVFMKLYKEAANKRKVHLSASMIIDVDMQQLDRDDLSKMADAFAQLHDLCLAYNVKLDFFGFDMMPSYGVGNDTGWRPQGVGVNIDTSQPYNIFKHPSYGLIHGDILEGMRNQYPKIQEISHKAQPRYR